MSLNAQLQELYKTREMNFPAPVQHQIKSIFSRLDAARITAAAPHVGEFVPRADFLSPASLPVTLKSLYASGPLILIFFRGRWCPYCDITLRAFNLELNEIARLGANVAAISPQTPTETALTVKEWAITYPVLADPGNHAAQSFGLAWALTNQERAAHQGFGIHLDQLNGDDRWTLPAPAVFVIDRHGIVQFSSVHSNWTIRTEPSDVLRQLVAMQRKM
jgi:peroxiredoxin